MRDQLKKIQLEANDILRDYSNGRFDNQLALLYCAGKLSPKICDDFRELVKALGFVYMDIRGLDYFIDTLLEKNVTERDEKEINTMYKMFNHYYSRANEYQQFEKKILLLYDQLLQNRIKTKEGKDSPLLD